MIYNYIANHSKTQMLKTENIYDLTLFLRVRELLHWMVPTAAGRFVQGWPRAGGCTRSAWPVKAGVVGGDSTSSRGLSTPRDNSSVLTTWQLGPHSTWSKRARRKSQRLQSHLCHYTGWRHSDCQGPLGP